MERVHRCRHPIMERAAREAAARPGSAWCAPGIVALGALHRPALMSSGRSELPATSTLLAFEAAARLGSITRAAEELATSHSAVSRHIRGLEKTFEVVLFERRGRGIALTTSGETHYWAVQTGLDALRDGARGLRDRRTGLTIGATLEISALLLHPVFPKLKRTLGEEVAGRIRAMGRGRRRRALPRRHHRPPRHLSSSRSRAACTRTAPSACTGDSTRSTPSSWARTSSSATTPKCLATAGPRRRARREAPQASPRRGFGSAVRRIGSQWQQGASGALVPASRPGSQGSR